MLKIGQLELGLVVKYGRSMTLYSSFEHFTASPGLFSTSMGRAALVVVSIDSTIIYLPRLDEESYSDRVTVCATMWRLLTLILPPI